MNRNELISKLSEFFNDPHATEHLENATDLRLNEILAEIASSKFNGRKLAPNYQEVNKFEVVSVLCKDVDRFVVSGDFKKMNQFATMEPSFEFNAEEIVDLLETAQTETEKMVFSFCK